LNFLSSIAPGIDLQRDVLAQMDFVHAISAQFRLMDAALVAAAPMRLRERTLATPLAERLELDRERKLLFINFEGLSIADSSGIAEIEMLVGDLLAPLQERVAVVVNCDNFHLPPALLDEYSAMAARLQQRCYSRVTRYGTGGFLKARL
jgi:propionate CoA-transferase